VGPLMRQDRKGFALRHHIQEISSHDHVSAPQPKGKRSSSWWSQCQVDRFATFARDLLP
jgi:hypothetical protein